MLTRRTSLCLLTAIATAVIATGCSKPERDARAITALTPELAPVVQGNNAFAIDLYHAAAAEPGNLFFSPFSVSAAFGMVYAGAADTTADEMRDVLDIGTDDASYHAQFGALIADLGGPHQGRGYQLLVANRLFGQAGFAFESPFLDVTGGAYGAPLQVVDFASGDASRQTINQWVSDQTEARIPELLQAGDIDGSTVLVAANAIYFDADWATQFDASKTNPAPFTRGDGSQVNVQMMRQEGHFRHGWREGVAFAELPYLDDEVSMVVLVPDEADGLPALEAVLDGTYIDELLADAPESEVEVGLPRFELHARLPLASLLKGLGMVTAFDATAADFSGMSKAQQLYLQTAVHEAFVRVDEEGTEAAAATAAGVAATSYSPGVVADRPFVFAIRDRLTTSLLFVGRITDPADITF